MQKSKRLYLLLCLTQALFCAVVSARDLDQDEALRLRQSGAIQSLEQFIRAALARYPEAKMLEAELEEKHGIYVYEIELLTQEGVVRELKFNAQGGGLIEDKEDD